MLCLALCVAAILPVQGQKSTGTRSIGGLTLTYQRTPRYQLDPAQTAALLVVRYADASILNPEDWDSTRRDRIPYEVDVVYTQYPVDTSQWLTPYYRLLSQRISNLKAMDSRFRNPGIRWNLVAQTDCKTEAQAEQMLHGFVVKYRIDLRQVADGGGGEAYIEKQYERVRRLIGGGGSFRDSIVFRVLDRHPDWQNLAVVMDWTGSMYPYGASVVRYHQLYRKQNRVSWMCVFNDGDDYVHLTRKWKPMGRTGGIYTADPEDPDDIMTTLKVAMQRGDGAEPEENNIEALLFAQRNTPNVQRLVLIADNKSPIRDMDLLPRLHRPVDVILCGSRIYDTHPHYVTLAWATGGSLQTLEGEYLFRLARGIVPPQGFIMRRMRYILRGSQFEAVPVDEDEAMR